MISWLGNEVQLNSTCNIHSVCLTVIFQFWSWQENHHKYGYTFAEMLWLDSFYVLSQLLWAVSLYLSRPTLEVVLRVANNRCVASILVWHKRMMTALISSTAIINMFATAHNTHIKHAPPLNISALVLLILRVEFARMERTSYWLWPIWNSTMLGLHWT